MQMSVGGGTPNGRAAQSAVSRGLNKLHWMRETPTGRSGSVWIWCKCLHLPQSLEEG